MDTSGWHTLRVGTGDEVVLVVDFSAEASRAVAGFDDLVPLLPDRYTVRAPSRAAWLGDPESVAGSDARLAAWLATADSLGPEVVAVLGYCAGCRLAAAFVDRIVVPTPPATIFFDPLPVVPWTLCHEFVKAVTPLTPGLGQDVVERAVEQARAETDRTVDLDELARWLSTSYAGLASRGCEEIGIEPEFTEQLISRLTEYLRYLTISAATPAAPGPAPTLVLRSREPVPAELREYPVARQLDVPRAELLASQEAADLVTQVLTGRKLPAPETVKR
ncbi:hypothetical protein AB0D32_10630 [Micromonospora sp. NPDC048170]|uniref:hypothetical protein n=1 Tax=Micromonospora sp. NPDC048170 TaxID=3154819 RepID=UPI0033C8583A